MSFYKDGDSFDVQCYIRPSKTTLKTKRLHRKITETDIWFPNDFGVAALQSVCWVLLLF